MLLTTQRAELSLADDEVARLVDAQDSRLEVTDGFVWVTVDGDRSDVVLAAGDTFVVDTADTVTVSALRGAAAVKVRANAGAAARKAATALRRAPGKLDQLFARFSLSPDALA